MSGNPVQKRRVLAASAIGTTLEWYDFFIYSAAAALVFSTEFFGALDPASALLASMATIGVTFIARPIGSAVIGNFGDRIGRKRMLILTLGIMGGATFLIGVLPTYAQIGAWAPAMLVVLRLAQGFSIGGEWAGAALMAVEHAPDERRGTWGLAAQVGAPLGLILATGFYLLMISTMTAEQFRIWGWRFPFWVGLVMAIVGYYLRTKVDESPTFEKIKSGRQDGPAPLGELFRLYRRPLLLSAASYIGNNTAGYVVLSFLLAYGTGTLGVDNATMLGVQISCSFVWLASIGISGYLSDKLHPRRVYLTGYVLLVLWAVPFMLLIDTADVALIYVGTLILALILGLSYGPQAALFASLFPARVRYSGASTAYALGAVLGGGLAPVVATWLVQQTQWAPSVGVYIVITAAVSLTATFMITARDMEYGTDSS